MKRASIIDNFERKGITFEEKEKQLILASFQTIHLKKKEYILNAGEVCGFQAFVVKGCCKVYFLDNQGQEHIIYFAVEDWWLADLESYHFSLPSKFYIQAIEDCELLWISKEVKEPLYKEIPVLERVYRLMLGQECIALQRRIMNKLSMDATTEYEDFCKRYPSLLKRLTNIQIASYLGISQEFLSKIRSKKRI